jgi:hypothetical protein
MNAKHQVFQSSNDLTLFINTAANNVNSVIAIVHDASSGAWHLWYTS